MNALALVAVPPAVVTATLLAPAVPAGVVAVIDVALTTTTLVAATPFTVTLVAPLKLVPVIVIAVPPLVGPVAGVTNVIVGDATYVNAPVWVAVPPAVVTVTSFKPAALAGVLAVIEVALDTTTFVADTPPIFTLVVPIKFVPVMVMVVAPKVEPLDGVTLEIVGAGTTYVNEIACVVDPLGVVTTIVLAPIVVDAGVTAVIEVALTTTTLVAATPPTFTLVAPIKFVPVMVIAVPPVVGPVAGLTLKIVGAKTT